MKETDAISVAISMYDDGYNKGRADAIDECISLARAEIDFESQAEQKRFVKFLEQLKEKKNELSI